MLNFIKGIHLNLSSDHSSGAEEDEPDRPPVLITAVIVVLSFVFLIFVAILSYTFLWKTTDSQLNKMDTGMANETRLNYEKSQDETLSSYKKLENCLYQITITNAMDMVIKEQSSN